MRTRFPEHAATLLVVALAGALAQPAAAQQRDTMPATVLDRRLVPPDIAERASDIHAQAVLRSTTLLEIEAGRVIRGSVSVQHGPLLLGGHVTGSVLAVHSDVRLQPGARVDGDLLVVGGVISGVEDAVVGGELRQYRSAPEPLLTDEQQGRERERARGRGADRAAEEENDRWWGRLERTPRGRTWTDFHVSSAGAYNRVEGLPVKLGPRVRHAVGDGQIRLDAFAVVRTASSFRDDSSDVGYDVLLESLSRDRYGIAVGARLFDVNSPVESWQLSELEAGLASFLARRDYRDYFERHGGQLLARAFTGPNVSLEVRYSDERWRPRHEENPFSLFNAGRAWRPNPRFDEGRFHLVNGGLRIDTRNDEDNPWSGWYVLADLERGSGRLTNAAPMATDVRTAPVPGDPQAYSRGLLDLRRYNRVGPNTQFNMRMVLGGWLGGDPLPVQRRFSVDGPGALPGFGFRRERDGFDVGTCNVSIQRLAGQPALCERIALAQVEYRGELYMSSFGDWGWVNLDGDAEWIIFADAGRGWLLRDSAGDGGFRATELPPLGSFRADLGFGLDFHEVGIYLAKAMTAHSEPPVLFVRVRHRF